LRRLLLPILRREMVSAALLRGVEGFILTDCPTNIQEAKTFEKVIRPCDVCVSIGLINQEDARQQAAASESGENLMLTYDEWSQPMIDFYRQRGKLIEVNLDEDDDDDDDDDDKSEEGVTDITEEAELERQQKRCLELIRQVGLFLELTDVDAKLLADAKVVFVVGGPGSGKGTQCDRLKDEFQLAHLSSGDLLRLEVEAKTPLGLEMEALMKQGKLVPMETVLTLIKTAMVKAMKSGTKGFLIDGYPREVEQGIAFENQIAPCSICLYFNATDETMTSRLLSRGETSGRSDDNQETIKLRLKTFHEQTMPVISYYSEAGKLIEIDAEIPPREVFERTLKGLREKNFASGKPNFHGGHPAW